MIKADKYYIDNLNQILNDMNIDENPRPKYKDGVSAHSYFITQVFEKYDLTKNEFPITTLRNTAIKTGIKELLTIYQEQSNTKEGFHKNNVFWWDEWMNKDNNIGRAYSYNLESHRIGEMKRNVIEVEPRIITVGVGIKTYDIEGIYNFTDTEIEVLKNIWENLFTELVHQDWYSFKNFLLDVRYLPQYHLAKENNFKNWILSKDYYSSNAHSNYTSVFITKNDSELYKNNNVIKVIKNNKVHYELEYNCIEQRESLTIENDKGNYRYELSRNQVNELIKGLQNNPFGRRNIISFWNWSNIDKKELVECAYETIWTVRKKDTITYLDMTLVQRSQDAIMATYINKTQYVALQMMIACHLGYEIGTFSHFIQNYHIYDRHLNACNELLNRTPIDFQPYFKLKCKKDFYNIRLEDFEIITSNEIKKIESELEIAV